MLYKNIYLAIATIGICLVSCNMGTKGKDVSVKGVLPDSLKAPSLELSNDNMKNLLAHFPADKNFPVIIDSAYMAQVSKHDSLGAKDVKMLVKFWHTDDLLIVDSEQVIGFYGIDSMKAHHEFPGKYMEGKPTNVTAYGLKKIELGDETLLVWALVSVQEEADPIYHVTTVYYTILNNNTILETFIMGRLMTGMDPPGEFTTIITGTLSPEGKLLLEEKEFSGDLDSHKGEIKQTHYEYSISRGSIRLKAKKQEPVKKIKLKKD